MTDRKALRTRGTIGTLLDDEALTALVKTVEPSYKAIPQQARVKVKRGIAVVGTEGVGNEQLGDTVAVYIIHEESRSMVEVLHLNAEQVSALPGTEIDLADFVRVFGNRLEVNLRIWQRLAAEAV